MLEGARVLVVFEADIVKSDLTSKIRAPLAIGFVLIFSSHPFDFTDAIESRESFCNLGADGGDFNQRGGYHHGEEDVRDQVTGSHLTVKNGAATHKNKNHANDTDDNCGKCGNGRDARHRSRNVPKQTVVATRK